VAADQLPAALDRTALDLARLRGGILTLDLAPADLGQLRFEMRINDAGSAVIAIQLADDSVRGLIENAAGSLRDALSREGFNLESFAVSSGMSSPERRENGQNSGFADSSARSVRAEETGDAVSSSSQARASTTQPRPGTRSLSLFA
jgi:flagellar hook-length control protein FliK